MQSSQAPRWRSVPRDAIALREWDSEFVVRNERTGNSHLLGAFAGRVLGVLIGSEDPLAAPEIAARLEAASLSIEPDDAPDAVDEVLAEFSRLGLAEIESQ